MREKQERNLHLEKVAPLQLVSKQNFKYTINEKEVDSLFLSSGFQDMNVVVISMVGASRKGKSFMMNMFLKYAIHHYSEGKSTVDWMKDENKPLEGFPWKMGRARVTTGILIWPEFFVCKKENGDNVCLILLDTQGTDESNTKVGEWAATFAMSSMASSVQIFNVNGLIQESNLQQLELFSEYSKLAIEQSGLKPYQKLVFLVRDWRYPYEKKYGFGGGQEYVEDLFQIVGDRATKLQLRTPRENIPSSYNEILCFLMPRLGESATFSLGDLFDGSFKQIDREFKDQLKILVPRLLSPENLVAKKINGTRVSVKQWYVYFKVWVNLFNSPQLPVPLSVFTTTAEVNNVAAKDEALKFYRLKMENVTGHQHHVDRREIEAMHITSSAEALKRFDDTPKMGGKQFSSAHRQDLKDMLQVIYDNYLEENDTRITWNILFWKSVRNLMDVATAYAYMILLLATSLFFKISAVTLFYRKYRTEFYTISSALAVGYYIYKYFLSPQHQ